MAEDTGRSFGALLRRHRLAAGLTQEALAERAGLGTRSIQHLERGEVHPQRATVQRLALALALTAEQRTAFVALVPPLPRAQTARRSRTADRSGGRPADRDSSPLTVDEQSSRAAYRPSSSHGAHNLPAAATSFIGRESEMAAVRDLLSTTRLLTLTGTGGTGKTRLALEVAATVWEQYPQGVWLVDLAPLTAPEEVPGAVARTLGLHEEAGQSPLVTLLAALGTRQLLLVLDTCEHLLEACAALADALLRACPGLRLLTTSREALGLTAETTWRVPSLALPALQPVPPPAELGRVAAVRLFVDRAQAVQPHFALTAQNASLVAQICRQLDGIPLALELAAVQLRGLSIVHLAARLDQRFRLLTGGSRSALPRQQTLRATVDWSYTLLSALEQILFQRLTVFVGSFTLEAAEAVCSGGPVAQEDVLGLLLRLVDKSLVVAEEHRGNIERYRVLDTLRQYGRDKALASGGLEDVYARHLTYLGGLADAACRAVLALDGSAPVAVWRTVLESEHMHLRQALQWALDRGAVDEGLHLAGVLWWYWYGAARFSEGQHWLSALLARPAAQARTPARAWALFSLAYVRRGARVLVGAQEVGPQTEALVAEALALAKEMDDTPLVALALLLMGRWTALTDYRAGRAMLEESLALCRALGAAAGVAHVLNSLGDIAWEQGDVAAAHAWWLEGLAFARRAGDEHYCALQLGDLGMLAFHQGDYATARGQIEESLALYHAVHERMGISNALGCLGAVARAQGDTPRAQACYEAKLALWQELGDRAGIAATLAELGALAQQRGNLVQAQALFTESLDLRRAVGRPAEVAASLTQLGGVAAMQGDRAHAATLYDAALTLVTSSRDTGVAALCLEGVAALVLAQGSLESAARLFGAAAGLRRATFVMFVWDERATREERTAAGQVALGAEAWTAAWAEGQALSWERTVALGRAALAPEPASTMPRRES